MSLGAIGVVYGNIGTSPPCAFREGFAVADRSLPRDNVLVILSLMLWALILIVTIKYLIFVMQADNNGEVGILALRSAEHLSSGWPRGLPSIWTDATLRLQRR